MVKEAGVDVQEWRPDRYVFTTRGEEEAKFTWSALPADLVYVEAAEKGRKPWDHVPVLRAHEHRTWFPVGSLFRLRRDRGRWFYLMLVGVFTIVPSLVVIPYFLPVGSETALAAGFLVPLLGLLAWYTHYLDLERPWTRLALGVVLGLVWITATGAPSIVHVVGAVWVFLLSNVLWAATVGWDRARFDQRLRLVGGPVPEAEWRAHFDRGRLTK